MHWISNTCSIHNNRIAADEWNKLKRGIFSLFSIRIFKWMAWLMILQFFIFIYKYVCDVRCAMMMYSINIWIIRRINRNILVLFIFFQLNYSEIFDSKNECISQRINKWKEKNEFFFSGYLLALGKLKIEINSWNVTCLSVNVSLSSSLCLVVAFFLSSFHHNSKCISFHIRWISNSIYDTIINWN